MSLTGKTIIVTRDAKQAEPFVKQIRDLGAETIVFPTIRITGPDDPRNVRAKLGDISNYDWIVFTSMNAVSYFFEFVDVKRVDLKGIKIACVGKKTAEVIADFNLSPSLVPGKFSVGDLFENMRKDEIKGKRILMPVSNLAAHEMEQGLRTLGALVQRIEIYKTVPYQNPDATMVFQKISDGMVDCITFFSPSALHAFVELMGENVIQVINSKQIAIAVIGPTTARAAFEQNLQPAIQPVQSDNESFLEALKQYLSSIEQT
jgi:uroporphyrinogen-III synthase